jgi:uncharacterized protein (DUF2235 family)
MSRDGLAETTSTDACTRRNIVICCDGTGKQFGTENSNVVKLYATLIINQEQIGYYHPGVGTMGAPNVRGRLGRAWSRIKGLAFGAGFMANVSDAYRYLMNTYREGDRVFLFGFSRGAYTVRALAGLLHTCGLLYPGNEELIPPAFQVFAAKSLHRPRGARTLEIAHAFKEVFSRDVLIDFAGVWDTVSSIGWIYNPVALAEEERNPIIKVGRQAVSIDERRCYYHDKLWGAPFKQHEVEFRVRQDIKQVWFAGVHSDNGGSYPEAESGLSKLALEWLLQEACRFGLRVDNSRADMILGRGSSPYLETAYVPPDPSSKLHVSLKGPWWLLECLPHKYYNKPQGRSKWRIPLGASRTIPNGSLVHESVQQRMNLLGDYQPGNLPDRYHVEPRATFAGRQHHTTALRGDTSGLPP